MGLWQENCEEDIDKTGEGCQEGDTNMSQYN